MMRSWFRSLLNRPVARPIRHVRRQAESHIESLEPRTLLTGTWSGLAHVAPSTIGTMELLSDGTVIAQDASNSKSWYKLTPDASGSYVNGTWSSIASMNVARLYYATNVLPDGRVLVLGGEYSGSSMANNYTNTGEIYDPVANTWTNIANFPQSQFGDDPTMVLPDGRVLAGYLSGPQTYIYDPVSNTWSAGGTKLRNDRSDEETWVKLPDNSILSYDIFTQDSTTGHAQRYIPASNTWVDAGVVPVRLSDGGSEIGGATVLPDGRVLFIGETGHSAYYTPSTNTWAAGPDIPGLRAAEDSPLAMLPNGKVLFAADTRGFNAPTRLYELNPSTNSIVDVTAGGPSVASSPAYVTRMLMLPSGQVLFTSSSRQLYAYTPDGSPQNAWRPTITSVVANGLNFTLTGTQLNGISAGASYGDDAEMDTNFPIIQLKNAAGTVYFARTYNWSSTGVATGSTSVTTNFSVSGIPNGTYSLTVIANGIASSPYSFTLSVPQADVAVTTSGPSSIPAGTNATYFITVKNNGPQAANLVLSDLLPVGSTFVSMTQTSGSDSFSFSQSGSTVKEIANASIASGAIDSFTLIVSAPGSLHAGANFSNTASVSSTSTSDSVQSNNSSTVTGSIVQVIASISVGPQNALGVVGLTKQFTAAGTYLDGTTGDVTNLVTWTSSNPAVATISSSGLVTVVGVGSSVITASSGNVRSLGATLTTIAPSFVVNTTIDDLNYTGGTTSLREAILAANSISGKTITFDSTVFATPQTITLTLGQLELANTTGIEALVAPAAGVTVSGGGISRVFKVDAGVTATFSGVTITSGNSGFDGGSGLYNLGTSTLTNCIVSGNTAVYAGGGVLNKGTITLTNSSISGNTVNSGFGGGFFNYSAAILTGCTVSGNSVGRNGGGFYQTGNATLTLTNCTVSGNSARSGGGLYTYGTTTLTNCTVSGNSASANGGGVYLSGGGAETLTNCTVSGNSAVLGGGVFHAKYFSSYTGTTYSGTMTLTNCTVSGNSAAQGGGVYNQANLNISNSIVAQNSASTSSPDFVGVSLSSGHNLIGATNGSSGWVASDLQGTVATPFNPMLAALGNYGGTTQSMALLPGSPAIDAGTPLGNPPPSGITGSTSNTVSSPITDQRGLSRVGTVDIGAFESQGFTLTVSPVSNGQRSLVGNALANPLTVTVVANNPLEPVNGGIVNFSANPAASGASATLSAGSSVISGSSATVGAIANNFAGAYSVTASIQGNHSTGSFTLTNQASVIGVSVGWGTLGRASLVTAADGVRLLSAGRSTDIAWNGINKFTITLNVGAALVAADVQVTGIKVANYGPVTVTGSGTTYTITIAQPINSADRVTITISNPLISSYTRRLDVLPGDVNDDGVVNATDIALERNAYFSGVYNFNYDIDGDGFVTIYDYNIDRALVNTLLPPLK